MKTYEYQTFVFEADELNKFGEKGWLIVSEMKDFDPMYMPCTEEESVDVTKRRFTALFVREGAT